MIDFKIEYMNDILLMNGCKLINKRDVYLTNLKDHADKN